MTDDIARAKFRADDHVKFLRKEVARLTRERNEALTALTRIASPHAAIPSMESGHFYAADCDACNGGRIARAALARIAALKAESAPDFAVSSHPCFLYEAAPTAQTTKRDPRDAEIAALREALDAAESWIERHQEEAHDGAEWASLLTKIDCAMRASEPALTREIACKAAHRAASDALAKGSPR